MAKYVANPVEVDAAAIVEFRALFGQGYADLDDGRRVHLTAAMTARHTPLVGDYVVTQDDGYVYVNPKAVFERKYSAVKA